MLLDSGYSELTRVSCVVDKQYKKISECIMVDIKKSFRSIIVK